MCKNPKASWEQIQSQILSPLSPEHRGATDWKPSKATKRLGRAGSCLEGPLSSLGFWPFRELTSIQAPGRLRSSQKASGFSFTFSALAGSLPETASPGCVGLAPVRRVLPWGSWSPWDFPESPPDRASAGRLLREGCLCRWQHPSPSGPALP